MKYKTLTQEQSDKLEAHNQACIEYLLLKELRKPNGERSRKVVELLSASWREFHPEQSA